nr:PEP-utilizing enzyme [Mycobacterium sp.]
AAGRVTRAPQADDTVTGAAAARELAYDATLRFTHELRSAVRELGTRLAGQEKLAAAEDIFYLTTEEALVMPVDARLRIKRRAAERERLQALVLPPVINGRWEPLTAHRPADNGELRGRTVSRGVAEGTVRVLGSVDDADLTSGEIAVLAAADLDCAILAGTPAAVVADSGRGAADPAVVARHLGVPFVVDVPGATARLVTGMRVRVDGTSGTVTVLADATEEGVAVVPGATLAQ